MSGEKYPGPGIEAVLAEAESMVGAGRLIDAIGLLDSSNAAAVDPKVQKRLLELRVQAGRQVAGSTEPPPWPPDYSDRFPGSSEAPEVAASELDADAVLSGILGHGMLIVRGLFSSDIAAELRSCIDRSLAARKAHYQEDPAGVDSNWFDPSTGLDGGPVQFDSLGSKQFKETGSVWTMQSPAAAHRLFTLLRSAQLDDLVRDYFGEPGLLSVRKWVLRCVEPNNGARAEWHQDGRFLGDSSIRTLNLWIALSCCGEGADAPGIEIMPEHKRKILPTGTDGALYDWTVGSQLVEQVARDCAPVIPRFEAGDAVFFDHYNLPRTSFGAAHSQRRYALESWFFAQSSAPLKQGPVLF